MNYGLLGEKLSHSFSPLIHKMLGNDDYGLFSVPDEDFDDFIRKAEFKAINVTIPYKRRIIPYLSEISENAKNIGSVNTVIKRGDGKLSGFNTDYSGLKFMLLKNGIELKGRKLLILGSGGTSLTARAVAKDLGAGEIVVVSRRSEDNYENLKRHGDAEVIINTTPVGMYPDNGRGLIKLSDFPKCEAVADVIYNPFYTELLLEAKERGIKYANGLLMLVAQAKAASDIFFSEERAESRSGGSWISTDGLHETDCKTEKEERETDGGEAEARNPSEPELACEEGDIIELIHRSLFLDLCNIVLIGMPSCGKTSLARELSGMLGKKFVDTDEEIVKRYKSSIPEIFEREGEQGFRNKESEIIKETGKERGLVIATGGGAVLREENRRALKQNAIVVFVERDIESLSLSGRPLSKSRRELFKMYEARKPLYESCCDIKIANNKSLKEAAEEIKNEVLSYEIIGN